MEKQKEYGLISRNTTHTHTQTHTYTERSSLPEPMQSSYTEAKINNSLLFQTLRNTQIHRRARTHTHRLQHTKQLQSKKSHRHGCTYTLAHSLLEKDIHSLVSVNRRESKDNLNTHIQPCRERSISCTVYVVCTRGTV